MTGKILTLIKKNLALIIAVGFALLAVIDLSHFGLPPTHDAEYHVMRFQQFYKEISQGIFYPRWAPDFNNGFGIPLFNYVYPLPNFVAALFHSLGFGFIDSFKLNMVLATLFGSIFFYLWSKKYWGTLGAMVSSIFYTFSPYHFVDIYVRGSVGEVWALAIFPALLWSYSEYSENKKNAYIVLSSVFLGLLIYSHNILALISFIFFTLYAFILIKKKRVFTQIKSFIFIVVMGFGLGAPFWLPAILETKYVTGLQLFDVTKNFTPIYKFFVPTWGFGLSPADPLNPMSVQLGYANILAVLLSIFVCILSKRKKLLVFFIVSYFLIFFMMTSYSTIFWKIIPLISYFQFPWRLLGLEILISSFLVGSIFSLKYLDKKENIQIIIASVLIVISVGLSFRYMKAPFYHQRLDSHYLTRSNFTDGTNSPGNSFNTLWLTKGLPKKQKDKVKIVNGQGSVGIVNATANDYVIVANSKKGMAIILNVAYFPAWQASIGNKKTLIYEKDGIVEIKVPKGRSVVEVKLTNTPIEAFACLYFLISLILLVLISNKSIDIINPIK
ncbi:MAG TPA: 6-pyruvoyl-tetrahydropterin synthase-related protein [Patescibacteria group bacterium]|nr:6-pyruvoyl-tetrahydropterin synthase-related protein [Patescibacteria group bacterium]